MLRKADPDKIEWTPANGGMVRAMNRNENEWRIAECGPARNALSIGEGLLKKVWNPVPVPVNTPAPVLVG